MQETVAVEVRPVQKKSKKKGLIIGLIVAATVILGVVVTGLLTNWFGLLSPLHRLIRATSNTLEAESMTISVVGVDGEEFDYKYTIDEAGDITLLIEDDNSRSLIHDDEGYFFRDYWSYAGNFEINDNVTDIRDNLMSDEVDWKDILKKFDAEEHVDPDAVVPFLKALYIEYLCDETWLEEKAGFKRDGDVYTFKPDIEELGDVILQLDDEHDLFSYNLKKDLKRLIKQWDEIGEVEKLEFTVDGKYLSKIVLEVSDNYDSYEVVVEFSDIDETVLSEVIDEVEEWIENDHCAECGNRMYGYVFSGYRCQACYYGYYYCERCGDYAEGSPYSSSHYSELCFDCYYYLTVLIK